ncbi:VOC family protein [Brumimicrobium aurantiacum]|uniref:VOC family protein n=1 Tax=Brumimicrobium aurantiacum TaxID=1737063 RepID=A0A3E1F0G1_9FLAO|nr:VOC family protein [Brumimicrobium aurantiacum]RFC55290.1 VOC family protein [Brumimicrobium aurantiacum]
MTTINTYLTFDGNCEEAFNFYKSVFGGDFAHIQKFKDMPENPKFPVAASDKEKIMHVSYPISPNSILLGSDTGGEWAANFKQGNNFSISINADSKEEADKIFDALSKNGEIIMPMTKTFWDSYFGNFTDQFGVQWMVSFDEPKH